MFIASGGVGKSHLRPHSPYAAARFPLSGIDPSATYRVTDLDHPDQPQTLSGKLLINPGLEIQLPEKPSPPL